jgi:hypothetical protein
MTDETLLSHGQPFLIGDYDPTALRTDVYDALPVCGQLCSVETPCDLCTRSINHLLMLIRLSRSDEVERYADWLEQNGERNYLEYAYKRGGWLTAQGGGE